MLSGYLTQCNRLPIFSGLNCEKNHKKQERQRNISMLIKRSHWLQNLSLLGKVQQALVQRTCELIWKALSTTLESNRSTTIIFSLYVQPKLALKTQSFSLGTLNPFNKVLSLHQIFIFWSVLSDGNGHMTKPGSSQGWLVFGTSSSITTNTEITSRLQSLWTCPFDSLPQGYRQLQKALLKKPRNICLVLAFISFLHSLTLEFWIHPCRWQVHHTSYPRHLSMHPWRAWDKEVGSGS